MAQPPETASLRLQSSLDSVPVQPRAQPNLNAPIEHKQNHDQHHQDHQQQRHQTQGQEPRQASETPQPLVVPLTGKTLAAANDSGCLSSNNSNSNSNTSVGRSPSTSDGKHIVNGVYPIDDGLSNRAAVAHPADPAPSLPGAPTGTQHNGGAPAPVLADMSNAQPPPGQARPPVTYASTTAYPPVGMPPVTQYMYSHPIPSDPYRPSPTTLPSMRTLDHRQPQAQPQHGIPLGSHIPAPMTPAPAPPHPHLGYYAVHPHPHMYGLSDPSQMRFAIAPGLAHDPRIALSGGRHKKEIKRRTKTGCLTCRKRRIKCDEAQPGCNNCKKSKRECLGYDPIFRQQQGPAAIQPAPNAQASSAPVTAARTAPVPSSAPHPYQTSYPPPLPSNITPDPAVSTAPQSIKSEPSYDYSTAIDPALQGDTARPPRYHQHNSIVPGADQGPGDSNHLRGGTPSSPKLSALSQPRSQEIMSTHTISPAKKMKIGELIALGGAAPQPSSAPPSTEMLDELTKLYHEVYAPGLAHFFETRWYDFARNKATTADSIALLHSNHTLVSVFSSFIQTIIKIKSTDPADMVYSGHLESSVVWSLACLPLSVVLAQRQQTPGSVPADDDPWEARGRLQVVEALLEGETLQSNPLTPPPAGNIDALRRNELEFWHQLGNYLLQGHASASPPDVSARDRCLGGMRSLLDGRENRDVLYSVAVLREYTTRWDAFYSEQNVPPHLEETDPRSKLAVATRFIRDESTSTGTTNVVRRFADVAYRAFVRPGVNVNRVGGRDQEHV